MQTRRDFMRCVGGLVALGGTLTREVFADEALPIEDLVIVKKVPFDPGEYGILMSSPKSERVDLDKGLLKRCARNLCTIAHYYETASEDPSSSDLITHYNSHFDGGAGYFLTRSGFLITAHHIIKDKPEDELVVVDAKGHSLRCSVLAYSRRRDVALLKTEDYINHAKTGVIGTDSSMRKGSRVFGIYGYYGNGPKLECDEVEIIDNEWQAIREHDPLFTLRNKVRLFVNNGSTPHTKPKNLRKKIFGIEGELLGDRMPFFPHWVRSDLYACEGYSGTPVFDGAGNYLGPMVGMIEKREEGIFVSPGIVRQFLKDYFNHQP